MILKNEIEKLTQRIEKIEIEYENLENDEFIEDNALNDDSICEIRDNLECEVYEIEEELERMLGIEDKSDNKIEKLLERTGQIKKDQDFFDPEDELDRMFPNRYDDDFDEESMSPESVFGDD